MITKMATTSSSSSSSIPQPQRTRIQVGLVTKNNSEVPILHSILKPSSSSSSIQNIEPTTTQSINNTTHTITNNNTAITHTSTNNQLPDTKDITFCDKTMFDLCDSHFAARHGGKKRKKNNSDGTQGSETSNPTKRNVRLNIDQNADTNVASGPMVEIVNGKIVVKQSSLVATNTRSGTIYDDYEEVVEDNFPTATYRSFAASTHSPVWTIEATRLFYKALRQCGTDFTMMQAYFPTRSRKQLKLKYFREERLHPDLITHICNTSVPLDLNPF